MDRRRFTHQVLSGLFGFGIASTRLVSPAGPGERYKPQSLEKGDAPPDDGSTVETLADLRNRLPQPGEGVVVLGHTAPFDGGGGSFVWRSGEAAPPDGGLIVASAVDEYASDEPVTGRWRRVVGGTGYSARWWGLHPDRSGQHNAEALQAAIDSVPEGAVVFLPAGRYDLARQIVMDGRQVDLVGEGDGYWGWDDGASVLRATSDFPQGDHVLLITDTTTEQNRKNNTRITDLQVVGGRNQGNVGTDGIHVVQGWNVRIERVTVKEAMRDGIHLATGDENVSNLCMLERCHASNNGRDGYYFTAHDSWAVMCRGNHNARNGITVGATNVGLFGLRLDLNGENGARILSNHCRCIGCMADVNRKSGFNVTGAHHTVLGNVSTANGTRDESVRANTAGHGFLMGVEKQDDEQSVFVANVSRGNRGNGYHMRAGQHVVNQTNVAAQNEAADKDLPTLQREKAASREPSVTMVDVGAFGPGEYHSFDVSVPDGDVGDAVTAQPNEAADGLLWSSYVRKPGTVEVRVFNPTSRTIRTSEPVRWTVHLGS
jgi:hypothetical protein